MWNRIKRFVALVLVIFLTVSSMSISEVWAEQEAQVEQTEEVEQVEPPEQVEPAEDSENVVYTEENIPQESVGASGNGISLFSAGDITITFDGMVRVHYTSVGLGGNREVKVSVEGETIQSIQWSSDDTSILTISGDKDGALLEGKSIGVATITATITTNKGIKTKNVMVTTREEFDTIMGYANADADFHNAASESSNISTTIPEGESFQIVGKSGNYYWVINGESYLFVLKSKVNIPAVGVTLDKSYIALKKDERETLQAEVEPELYTGTTSWSSSNTNIATINQNGRVTAVKEGATKVHVTAEKQSGNIQASSTISVWAEVAQTEAITSKPVDAKKGAVLDSASAGNILSNTKVTIIGQCGDYYYVRKSDGSLVFVEKTALRIPVKSIELDFEETTIGIGQTYQFSADVAPELATDKSLNWSSSNANIVTIDKNGKMVALKVGYAYIEAKSSDGLVIAKCGVNVQTTPVYDFASIRSVDILTFGVDYDCVIMSFEANAKGDVDASYHIVFMDEKGKTAYKQSNMYGETNIEMHYIMEGFDYNKSFTVQISASYMRNGKRETKSSKKLAFKTQKPYLSARLKKIAKSSFDLKIEAMPEAYYDKLEIYYRKKGAAQYNKLAKKYYEIDEDIDGDIIRINQELIAGKTYEFEVRLIKNKKVICKDKVKVARGYTDLKVNSNKSYTKTNLSWKKIAFADGYEIYRSEKKGVLGKKIQTIKKVNTTTYSDATKDLKKGKKYYYQICPYWTQGTKIYKGVSNQVEIVCRK